MTLRRMLVLVVAIGLAAAFGALAQDTSKTEVMTGQATTTTATLSGTIVYVAGNELVVRLDSGEVKDFQVAPNATATTEDGTEVTIRDAKPGMRLTSTLTITTAPQTIETIRTIKGKVWNVQPPSLVILTLPEGNRQFRVPDGQKFTIDGNEATIWDLRNGQEVTATVIKTVPETVASLSKKVAAKLPPPTPPVEGALLVEEEAQVAEASPPPALPATGSMVPLLGLLGVLLTGASLGLSLIRP